MTWRAKRLSSIMRAPWNSVPVDAAMVDSQPMAANLPDLPAVLARRTVYKPQGNQLRLPGVAMPAWSADWRLVAVSNIAPVSGSKSTLANDVLRLAAVAHSVEGRLELDDAQGAALLARHRDGSPRRPLQPHVRRWHDATRWLRCALWVDPKTHKWFPLAEVTALYGSTVLAPPEWSRHPHRGKDGGWTLSAEGGIAARARLLASGNGSAAGRVVTALEHMLACGFDGGKVSQLLRPASEKAGGHGSAVPIAWREAMTLAGIAWNWHDKAADEGQRKRWGRIVARLRKAGYMAGSLAGEAPAGDSIEIVEVVRGSRAHPGGLRFRASARFVAAAAQSDNKQFLRVSLGDWLGFAMPEQCTRQALEIRNRPSTYRTSQLCWPTQRAKRSCWLCGWRRQQLRWARPTSLHPGASSVLQSDLGRTELLKALPDTSGVAVLKTGATAIGMSRASTRGSRSCSPKADREPASNLPSSQLRGVAASRR